MRRTQLTTDDCLLATDPFYMASDHLSSAALIMDSSGNMVSSRRYYPFGEERTELGTWLDAADSGYTDLGYTGQRNYGDFGLMDYNARFYSPSLGRFTQADTIVPNLVNTQSWNRYSYTLNNPVKYVDPTGHTTEEQMKAEKEKEKKFPPPPPSEPEEELINLATSIEKNTPFSQYYPYIPGTDQKQWLSNNLCGFIVLSILLEHYTSLSQTLKMIWQKGGGSTQSSIYGFEILDAIESTFPKSQNWNGNNYSWRGVDNLRNGSRIESTDLGELWWEVFDVQSLMMDSFEKGHHLIPLVEIDDSGNLIDSGTDARNYNTDNVPNHWVLVVDMNEEYVTIINPFQNRYEKHSWDFFLSSMSYPFGSYALADVWKDD